MKESFSSMCARNIVFFELICLSRERNTVFIEFCANNSPILRFLSSYAFLCEKRAFHSIKSLSICEKRAINSLICAFVPFFHCYSRDISPLFALFARTRLLDR